MRWGRVRGLVVVEVVLLILGYEIVVLIRLGEIG